jgi:hypothetical protein
LGRISDRHGSSDTSSKVRASSSGPLRISMSLPHS